MENQVVVRILGGLVSKHVSYSDKANAFLTNGYVSSAGNVYFNALRFAEGIVIKEDVGEGYKHRFLNGIRIYDVKSRELLADRTYHRFFYSKSDVKYEVKTILVALIQDAARSKGYSYSKHEVDRALDMVLDQAFSQNQLAVAERQTKYLSY
jgi:hypothetical protein